MMRYFTRSGLTALIIFTFLFSDTFRIDEKHAESFFDFHRLVQVVNVTHDRYLQPLSLSLSLARARARVRALTKPTGLILITRFTVHVCVARLKPYVVKIMASHENDSGVERNAFLDLLVSRRNQSDGLIDKKRVRSFAINHCCGLFFRHGHNLGGNLMCKECIVTASRVSAWREPNDVVI